MWKFIDRISENEIQELWEKFKDIPMIFDDESAGDFEKFSETLAPAKWYKVNDGYIMLSNFEQGMAVWHTLVMPGELSYKDSWEIMLDVFERFGVNLIVSGVPEFNPRALRAAEKAGFVITKIQPQYTKRYGKMFAMHFMAIDKEAVCQRLYQLQ